MNELSTLPLWESYSFYRRLAKLTEKYFEDPENQKRFEEWKQQRQVENGELKMES